MEDVRAAKADLLVVSNTGCHMQLIAGAQQSGPPIRVAHTAEVMEESYAKEGRG